MGNRKQFTEKVGDKTIKMGLMACAVMLTLADAVGSFLLSFPDQRTSLSQVLRRVEKNRPRSVGEYFEELKEISGVNFRTTLCRLKQKGLISATKSGYILTGLGRGFVAKLQTELSEKAVWDSKWRLITFDIPEKRRKDRNWLRGILKSNEFRSIHKSVFVGKYALPERIYRQIYKRKLDGYMHLLTVGQVDNEEILSAS